MQTVADEVAHRKMMDSKHADLKKVEDEVMYLGQDAYVPRLVASSVPIVKPKQESERSWGRDGHRREGPLGGRSRLTRNSNISRLGPQAPAQSASS